MNFKSIYTKVRPEEGNLKEPDIRRRSLTKLVKNVILLQTLNGFIVLLCLYIMLKRFNTTTGLLKHSMDDILQIVSDVLLFDSRGLKSIV